MLKIGIVGLPNVGKSTLFNALTKSKQADAQNYPFCTIEPNVGIVEVPDERLVQVAAVAKSKKVIPTAIEFVDIAGLVKGASEGEGLGNKFLSHIREVDAIAHVVRAFDNIDVTHVHGKIDPKDDAEVINLELILADMQTVSRRLEKTKKQAKGVQAKELKTELNLLERLFAQLEAGKLVRGLDFSEDELLVVRDLHLLTYKPMLYVVNTDENAAVSGAFEKVDPDTPHVPICAKLEADFIALDDQERIEFMEELGLSRTGLDSLIVAGYELLGLVTFLTAGEPEARAWTVKQNTPAPEAAGVIHTDFIKGFIKADITNWEDFVRLNGWNGAKEAGKLQLVGRDYEVKDGDVCYFHINA